MNKEFRRYARRPARASDGVVKSVEDGMCVIAWEDGEVADEETAVQKFRRLDDVQALRRARPQT